MKDVVLFFFTAMYDFDDIACIAIMFVTGFFVCTNIALSNQWLKVMSSSELYESTQIFVTFEELLGFGMGVDLS